MQFLQSAFLECTLDIVEIMATKKAENKCL